MEIQEIIKEIYSNTYDLFIAVILPIVNLIEKYYMDNPMFKIVLAFVPALLGLAYPLIIQTLGRLNDQYKSTHIVERFKKEFSHRLFIWLLRISVLLTLLCLVLSIWVFLIAFVSVVFLLVVFFWYLSILLRYQNGHDLFLLYIKRLTFSSENRRLTFQKKKILTYWHPIIDIFQYSIRENDRKLETKIYDSFILNVFTLFKDTEQGENDFVTFPNELYNSSYDIIHSYINTNERDYYQRIEKFIGSLFFRDTFGLQKPQYFSQETLTSMWNNLVLLVEHERGDKIYNYWRFAHQYSRFNLEIPRADYDSNYKETDESIRKRENISKYRDAFSQFHTALGAYLMYKKDCQTLKKIWFFTQSQPPSYELVPSSPEYIFNYFFLFFNDEFFSNNVILRFWFKDLSYDEMNNGQDVRAVLCEYIGLLFLRLYVAKGFYGNHPITTFPTLPKKQSEKRDWEDNLLVFKRILEKLLKDKEFIKCLGLDKITKENCETDGLKYPPDYIDELIEKVKENFKRTLDEANLDEEKTQKLDENTINSIRSVNDNISRIKGADVAIEDRDAISEKMEVIRGTRMLLNKEAFISDPSIHHINADSIVGESIKHNYYYHFASKISLQRKKASYKVAHGLQFSVIDKLMPNPDIYIILSFGVNIKYLKDYKKLEIEDSSGVEDYFYKSIPIFSYDFGFSPVYNTLYLIKRADLPMIKHVDWSTIKDMPEKTKKRWQEMEQIDENLKIYKKITILSEDQDLKNEYINEGKTEEELSKMLEIDIDFLGYCWFRKDVEIIEIKENEMLMEGSKGSDVDSIEPLT